MAHDETASESKWAIERLSPGDGKTVKEKAPYKEKHTVSNQIAPVSAYVCQREPRFPYQ